MPRYMRYIYVFFLVIIFLMCKRIWSEKLAKVCGTVLCMCGWVWAALNCGKKLGIQLNRMHHRKPAKLNKFLHSLVGKLTRNSCCLQPLVRTHTQPQKHRQYHFFLCYFARVLLAVSASFFQCSVPCWFKKWSKKLLKIIINIKKRFVVCPREFPKKAPRLLPTRNLKYYNSSHFYWILYYANNGSYVLGKPFSNKSYATHV